MSRFQSQLNTATRLIDSYRSGEPFHLYLKQYFAANRKHGASDRRVLRDLCYAYFRIGHLGEDRNTSDRLLAAYYIVIADPMPLMGDLRPDWPNPVSFSIAERVHQVGWQWKPESVFPWIERLSSSIEVAPFVDSLLHQPDLFIRIRPGQGAVVRQKLDQDQIAHRVIDEHCLALSNATSLESRFLIDQEIVVQDLSSQRIAELFRFLPERKSWRVWDACAASGGKSLLTYDQLPQVQLICTDLRPNILRNLQSRLQRAGIPVEQVGVDDLTQQRDRTALGQFDLILADVPCTGSGTWSRTPEQISSFDPQTIGEYAERQQAILHQLIPQLTEHGHLLYMTCSVFQQENESVIDRICASSGMQVVALKTCAGYNDHADNLFGALLKRSSNP